MLKFRHQNKGFTLMEVIVAVGVIITALVTIIGLISFSISGIRLNKSKTIAFGLAQEGLEVVKNIRDNNWLNNKRTAANWRDDLGAGDARVQYNSKALMSFAAVPLRLSAEGLYQYDEGSNTMFYRKISITYLNDDQIKVTVQIDWNESGRNHNLTADTLLYNYLKED